MRFYRTTFKIFIEYFFHTYVKIITTHIYDFKKYTFIKKIHKPDLKISLFYIMQQDSPKSNTKFQIKFYKNALDR